MTPSEPLGTINEGHNQLEWAKVRKRAILRKTTIDDWELASDFQRKVIHQIELALISVEDENNNKEEEE